MADEASSRLQELYNIGFSPASSTASSKDLHGDGGPDAYDQLGFGMGVSDHELHGDCLALDAGMNCPGDSSFGQHRNFVAKQETPQGRTVWRMHAALTSEKSIVRRMIAGAKHLRTLQHRDRTKKQHTRWVATARYAAGAERDAVEKLLQAVLLQGRNTPKGGKRAVFARVYFDTRAGEMTIWLHRNWTHNGMESGLRAVGLELTNHRPGEAHIAGPLEAPSGLGRGQHMVSGLDLTQELRTAFADAVPEQVLARLERVTRYDYGREEGLYVEVGHPCTRVGPLPDTDHPDTAFQAGSLAVNSETASYSRPREVDA